MIWADSLKSRARPSAPDEARAWRLQRRHRPPAARAVGAEYAGVDLLPASDGRLFVLEVNGIPGWRALQQTTETDIAAAIVGQVETSRRPR